MDFLLDNDISGIYHRLFFALSFLLTINKHNKKRSEIFQLQTALSLTSLKGADQSHRYPLSVVTYVHVSSLNHKQAQLRRK